MKAKNDISQELACKLFEYNPDTGVVTHKERPESMFKRHGQYLNWNSRYPGKQVGSKSKSGYLYTKINGTDILVHRIAWIISNGEIPDEMYVDHINMDRSDNRMLNLRLANQSQNLHNCGASANSKSGHKGVLYNPESGKWRAVITVGNERMHLGYHKELQGAIEAYAKASIEIMGEFSNSNK